MLTVNDIKNAKFRKTNIGGYKAEDVDNFLDEVQDSYEKLQKENLNLTQKIKILADRVSQYRKDEDSVKTALVSAQKLANAAVSDAQKEADAILRKANAEADSILKNANNDILTQKETLASLKKAVKEFRSEILSRYKEHLKLVNSFNAEDRLPANYFENRAAEKVEEIEETPIIEELNDVEVNKIENIQSFSDEVNSVKENNFDFEVASSSKFSDLKFGEDYDVSTDVNEEPVGLFS